MNSLREIIESSPSVRHLAFANKSGGEEPQPLAPARWDWALRFRRSAGRAFAIDRRHGADHALDVCSAPLPAAGANRHSFGRLGRARARRLGSCRSSNHDSAREQNGAGADCPRAARHVPTSSTIHGGTTATLLTRATGARHRVGFEHYQYARLHNHLAPPSLAIWQRPTLHSVEQQLALIGWTGVPVTDRPATRLAVTDKGARFGF